MDLSNFEERIARGRAARKDSPRSGHARWAPPPNRPDPVALLQEQAANRVPELVPIRYGRMMASPFAFYRGAALIMASDLSGTPNSGIITQLCGDAHLSNFGVSVTQERNLVFDVNDFDETLPGPWEWDLKRLAASFEIAGRHAGFSAAVCRETVLTAARSYRAQMLASARAPVLTAWYDRLDEDRLLQWMKSELMTKKVGTRQVRRGEKILTKARRSGNASAFSKLVGVVDGRLRILAAPPLIEPVEELFPVASSREFAEDSMRRLLDSYTDTLILRNHPVQEFHYVHMARKVVGVGSVGTQAWVLLLCGRDDEDPLMLQAKEAQASVLERFLGKSEFSHHGQRVVVGQRLLQASSDIFLGWQQVSDADGVVTDFYVRQLKDWKGSVDFYSLRPRGAKFYAEMCGQTLARAHARTGDGVAIAAYLGTSNRFDRAIADFSADYADQNDRDFAAFTAAISSGRIQARPGL